MRIREVRAHAFGPLEEEQLELAEGMSVIVGPNESGKSTWHAALYAALCGMRRGRGRRARDDEEFARRHQPWGDGRWAVSCTLDLPDGRTVELRHDLAGRVDCTAHDVDLGTDVAGEIIHDGAPDGSRWLGIDRRAFLSVASIRQAQILTVTDHAGALQESLQRAAATAGTDETAAAALDAIEAYAREHVGLRRANSRKPLMEAVRRREAAREARDTAVAEHEEWLRHEEEAVRLEAMAVEAKGRARAAEVAHLRSTAGRLAERAADARELSVRNPGPPPELRQDDEVAEQVATALQAWERRPDPQPLTGPSAVELQARLAGLPEEPRGDLDPSPAVAAAHRALLEAQSRHEAHLQQRPGEPPAAEAAGVGESELIELARELETPVPPVDPELQTQVERLRARPVEARAGGGRAGAVAIAVAAAGGLIAGAVLLAGGQAAGAGAGAISLAVVLGILAIVLLLRRRTGPSEELHAAEARLFMAEQMAATSRQRRQEAAARARARGLAADAAALRRLADERRRAGQASFEQSRWEERRQVVDGSLDDARRRLVAILEQRGARIDEHADLEGLEGALDAYEAACGARRGQATAAAQRRGLEQALEVRLGAEDRLAQDEERLERAHEELRAAAPAGIADETAASTDEDGLGAWLRGWQRERDQRRAGVETARDEWSRLRALLDGRSVEELEDEAGQATGRAAKLAEGLAGGALESVDLGDDAERTVRELRDAAENLGQDVAAARSALRVRAERLLSVPEAEEALEAAETELDRVESLAGALDTTRRFLAAAQDRVHRDIAPVLAAKVRDRLARVTDGRYRGVRVEPETLRVHVQDAAGEWRDAALVSQGTAEQVYLLLRVAMAEILTAPGADCPLLLDDVTVQSDAGRTQAMLDVLHEVSAEHQVILFSQEDEVAAWAREHLEERDRLVDLEVLSQAI